MDKKHRLRDLPPEDRPRERLREVGVDNLSLQELLALIIEKGGRSQNVLQVSQNLLSHFGNLKKIKEASVEELRQVKGIGLANACKLQAALKLGEKALADHKQYGEKIETPEDVFNLLKDEIGNKKREHFKLLSLTSKNRLISADDISVGTLDSSLAHPREIFQAAISKSASSIILVHNHPSGDLSPSKNDSEITRRIERAGKIVGIELLDHVILTGKDWKSLKNR